MSSKEKFQQFLHHAFPLIKKLDITIESLDSERVVTSLPASDFNNNHLQTVYAGVQFSIMEVTGGIIFSAAFDLNEYFMVVKEMTIRYHKPARGKLTCSSTFTTAERDLLITVLQEEGKAEKTLPIELSDSEGVVVATAEAVYYLTKKRK